jgi:hypothetical protein
MSAADVFESALREIDRDPDPDPFLARLGLYMAAGTTRWSVSNLWKYATTPKRETELAKFLVDRCDPEPGDVPLLRRLLAHRNLHIAESAALLLVRLQGNAALEDVMPVLKRSPDGSRFTTPLLVTIAELRTPEAERCLFGDPPKNKSEHLEFDGTQLHAAQRLGSTRLMKQVADRAMFIGIADETNLRSSIAALDVLVEWPNKARVFQYLDRVEKTCMYPGDPRLLRACLGDRSQYDFVRDLLLVAHKAGWYDEEVEKRKHELQAAWKARDIEAWKAISDSQDLFEQTHIPEILHLAVYASRILRIHDVIPAVRNLLKCNPYGHVLHDQALFTYAVLCGCEHMDEFLSFLRIPSYIVLKQSDTQETAVRYFVDNLRNADYSQALAKFTDEYVEVVCADGDDDAEYAAQAIELLVARRPPESVVDSIVRMIHARTQDEQRKRAKDRLSTLIERIRRGAGRRFLNIMVPPAEQIEPQERHCR